MSSSTDAQSLGGARGQQTTKLATPVHLVATRLHLVLAEHGGVNVHAERALERLRRYLARPRAQERLEELVDIDSESVEGRHSLGRAHTQVLSDRTAFVEVDAGGYRPMPDVHGTAGRRITPDHSLKSQPFAIASAR